jgi:4-hydroxy-3-polyprenylbenzoate decarboxylase
MGIWHELGLSKLRPQSPWFGTPIGDWLPRWDEAAARAAAGQYLDNGKISEQLRRGGIKPETRFVPRDEDHGTRS